MPHPPEPTSEACSAKTQAAWGGRRCFACWYPQMGGYCGKCVVVDGGNGGCFDVYVWHDGEFPFEGDEREPVHLHHCVAEQFSNFGNAVSAFLGRI